MTYEKTKAHTAYARERFPRLTDNWANDYEDAMAAGEVEQEFVFDPEPGTPGPDDPRWVNAGPVFEMDTEVWSGYEAGDEDKYWVVEYPEWRIDAE